MQIKEIFSKGIEGGWRGEDKPLIDFDFKNIIYIEFEFGNDSIMFLQEIVLDPKFWEAVGKVEGWGSTSDNPDRTFYLHKTKNKEVLINVDYQNKMHQMIDHLADGGTIESYIKTL